MAPEQAMGSVDEIDSRTDIFAFGAILYHLLTGRPPFVGSALEILHQTVSGSPSPPTDIIRQTPHDDRVSTRRLLTIPRRLEDICMQCLERERNKRPTTLDQVALVLEQLHGEGGPAPRTGSTEDKKPKHH